MPGRTPVVRLFDRLSAIYDAPLLQSLVYRPAQEAILAWLRPANPGRIADIGCGTGILTSRVRRELEPELVCGCDASDGMLGQARARSAQVAWIRCASESLPFPDSSLDAIVSSHAFHWFDQAAALREFRRVLVPGGMVAIVFVVPRTRSGTNVVDAGFGGAGHFPDQRSLRQQFIEVGFLGVNQSRVRRGPFKLLSPDLVTMARVPAS